MQILAISNEGSAKVASFVSSENITYTVGLSTEALGVYGGGGIPHAYLIGADGVVLWDGHPASLDKALVEEALQKAFVLRAVVPELKPAATAFGKGKFAEAKSLAEAAKAKGGRGVAEDADYVIGRVAEIVAGWKQAAEKPDADKLDVLETLGLIQQHYPGTAEATEAAAKEKALKADPEVQKALDAEKKLDKLIAEVRRAEGDAKKLKPIQKKLEKFIEANAGTKAAKRAQQVLDGLFKK